jgi:Trypsin
VGVWRRRGLAAAGALLALVLVLVGLPKPASQAAQGQLWPKGVPWAGSLQTDTERCSATVVSEFLVITAKHCGMGNPRLKLDVASRTEPGHDQAVKEIVPNPDLDVEAIILFDRTGLSETPLRETVDGAGFSGWGYGRDRSNVVQGHLTRADFTLPEQCDVTVWKETDGGDLCWQTDATNSMCLGDSGGPIIQHSAIIGIFTEVHMMRRDCGMATGGRALTVQQMQPWLDQMIKEANPLGP